MTSTMTDNRTTDTTLMPAAQAEALVHSLYHGILGRPADPVGLAHWSALLQSGAPVAEVVNALAGSDECRQRLTRAGQLQQLQQHLRQHAPALLQRALTIVDIGAQELEDEQHIYAPLTGQLPYRVIGFEPLQDKIDAALARHPDAPLTLYPTFIGDGQPHTFHINNYDATSSLLPLNQSLTAQLVDLSQLATVSTETVSTSTLDSVLADTPRVDFLKLDIQGFELPVLEHASAVLQRTNVIHCEVSFAPIYAQQALFSQVESLLRAAGFDFIDFSSECRYAYHNTAQQQGRDRLGWGDAIFFRRAELITDHNDLLAQSLIALLVYGKPTLAARLAEQAEALGAQGLTALFTPT